MFLVEGKIEATRVDARKKDGGWQGILHYKVDGKWKQKTKQGYSRRSDALAWAQELEYELLSNVKSGVKPSDMTLGELFDKYHTHLERKNRAKSTLQGVINAKKFLEPMNQIPVIELTHYQIESYFIDEANKNGQSYKQYVRVLNVCLNFAVESLEIITKNPLKKIELPDLEDNRTKYVSEKLYEKIMNDIKPKYRLVIEVAYKTGMRVSEILGITLDALREPGYIDVFQQYMDEDKEFSELKTKNSYRKVPISMDLWNRLRNMPTDINGRIFYNVRYISLYKVLIKYNITMHCFRHTFATKLCNENVISYNRVAQIIGDTLETVMNTYVHSDVPLQQKEADYIRNLF